VAGDTITDLLVSWRNGDRAAVHQLIPLVYEELRALAHRQLGGHGPQMLQTTALVHEVYLRLAGRSQLRVEDRRHFFAIAARAMRQLVVDHARRQAAGKRGGSQRMVPLDGAEIPVAGRAAEIVAIDAALDRLAAHDARLSQVVELRFFGGLSVEETADVLGSSPRTVKRDWRKARAFLYRELTEGGA
jgi:RNA polymerase sigma-70 factor (ECF subfamily)